MKLHILEMLYLKYQLDIAPLSVDIKIFNFHQFLTVLMILNH